MKLTGTAKDEYTPDGTRYAACTTIQYGDRPSSNAVALTVEPLATQTAAPEWIHPFPDQISNLLEKCLEHTKTPQN
jgi:hypothetical protein